jgi:hypothetical protein
MRQYISYSQPSRDPYEAVRKELLYSVLVEFVLPMKIVRAIKTYSEVRTVNIYLIIFLSEVAEDKEMLFNTTAFQCYCRIYC